MGRNEIEGRSRNAPRGQQVEQGTEELALRVDQQADDVGRCRIKRARRMQQLQLSHHLRHGICRPGKSEDHVDLIVLTAVAKTASSPCERARTAADPQ